MEPNQVPFSFSVQHIFYEKYNFIDFRRIYIKKRSYLWIGHTHPILIYRQPLEVALLNDLSSVILFAHRYSVICLYAKESPWHFSSSPLCSDLIQSLMLFVCTQASFHNCEAGGWEYLSQISFLRQIGDLQMDFKKHQSRHSCIWKSSRNSRPKVFFWQ